MSFKHIGSKWRKNIKIKVAVSLIVSNVTCLALFPSCKNEIPQAPNSSIVDVQINGELLTSFEKGKKALAIHYEFPQKIEVLLKEEKNETGRITVETNKEDASVLLSLSDWKITPEISGEIFKRPMAKITREIHY